MKLSPSKFQCARQVTFGGVNIEALKQRGDTETRVYLTPEDENIQKFLDIEEPKTKKDAQMICGMAARVVLNFIFFDKNIAKLGICVGR